MSRVSEAGRPAALRRWAGGPPRLLLSPRFRLAAGIITVACAVITAVLGAAYAGQHGGGRLDRVVDDQLRSALLRYGSVLHPIAGQTPLVVTVLGVLACCGCLFTHRPRGAVLVAIGLPAGALADIGLKPLIHRTIGGSLHYPRYPSSLSYPSGHTIGAFTLAVIVLVLLLGPGRPPLRPAVRALLACAVLAIACVVPVAMITLRMHYFTDTVGGAALATALVLATALLIDTIGSSIRQHMLGKGLDILHRLKAGDSSYYTDGGSS